MNDTTVFKIGDRVYDHKMGWGIIEIIHSGISVRWDKYTLFKDYTFEYAISHFSFTEYNYVTGGFSQERPELPVEKWSCIDKPETKTEPRYVQIVYKGKVYGEWNQEANQDFPEDLVFGRDLNELIDIGIAIGRDMETENPLLK